MRREDSGDFYIIKGLSSALDGLVVVGGERIEDGDNDERSLVEITEISRPGTIVGDRELRIPIPGQSMFIDSGFLFPITDPGRREFDSTNPFGRCLGEWNHTRDGIEMNMTEYENALHVSVRDLDGKRTVWDGYFFHEIEAVIEEIHGVDTSVDRDDLTFELDRIKRLFAGPSDEESDDV